MLFVVPVSPAVASSNFDRQNFTRIGLILAKLGEFGPA